MVELYKGNKYSIVYSGYGKDKRNLIANIVINKIRYYGEDSIKENTEFSIHLDMKYITYSLAHSILIDLSIYSIDTLHVLIGGKLYRLFENYKINQRSFIFDITLFPNKRMVNAVDTINRIEGRRIIEGELALSSTKSFSNILKRLWHQLFHV